MSPSPSGDAVTLREADIGHGGDATLRRLNLHLGHGERVLVLGPNGSGKSSLLATLAGLLPPVTGQVSVLGLDPLRARRRVHADVGYLGHADPLYPDLTGRENLAFHARLRGLGRDAVDAAILRVGMTTEADRRVSTCSHGMARRLGLAKALLGDPRVLILDEPDSGLDAGARLQLAAAIGRDPARTVVLATHHADDYDALSPRLLVLEEGTATMRDGMEVRA